MVRDRREQFGQSELAHFHGDDSKASLIATAPASRFDQQLKGTESLQLEDVDAIVLS
jgi:hypothetical protein